MFVRKLIIAGIALGTCNIAASQEYFDFGRIPGLPENPAVQLDLNPAMLGFVLATARSTNPAAADLLAGVQGVRVRIYNTIDDMDDVRQYLNDTSTRLERDDWQQVVRVQEDGEVRVYMRGDEAAVTGLAAMVLGNAEAIFVSVAGSITPAQLVELASTLGAGDALAALAPITTAVGAPAPQ